MSKKTTITIGIPAYNEEANIGYLLGDLLKQKQEIFCLEKIYVYSDGSTDRTNLIVSSCESELVELIIGPGRQGQAYGQNYIFNLAKSDLVILINADMKITDCYFLENIAKPIIEKQADLTSSNLLPLPARNFFERILVVGVSIKNSIFESYESGNNYFTCHGAARAFSKRLYVKLRFSGSVGEDAYSFLYCLYNGWKYKYVRSAIVYYRLPDNFCDHAKQSTRFFRGKNNFSSEFDLAFIKKHNRFPLSACFLGIIRILPYIVRNFAYFILYIFVLGATRIKSFFAKDAGDNWSISVSSKKVR